MTHTVLICDDEVHILHAAKYKFQRAGYEVLTADDGQAAWELLQEHAVEVVVTDYHMPRLNGLELAQHMAEDPATAAIPVVLLTAKGFELQLDEIQKTSAIAALLNKPFSPRGLLARVGELLSETESAMSAAAAE